MKGINGSANIWDQTKQFLKSELDKESKSNDTRITILPFQDKALPTISVNPAHINWSSIESTLDNHIKDATYTNICDAWLKAEKNIDPICENYLVLMTDGIDNIGGSANVDNRQKKLADILQSFCGKYPNTKGFYVTLTHEAEVKGDVLEAINMCDDIYIVDADESAGIHKFGGFLQNKIHINTRDIPCDIEIGFSNSGTFNAYFEDIDNEYVDISIKNGQISNGKLILQINAKEDLNLHQLNRMIGESEEIEIPLMIKSPELIITNPEISLTLLASDFRTLDISNIDEHNNIYAEVVHTKPFLWIKSKDVDTLRWDLGAMFNECAHKDKSEAVFKVISRSNIPNCHIIYNSEELGDDSLIFITPNDSAVVKMLIPASESPMKINLALCQVKSRDLDRINDRDPRGYAFTLSGEYKSELSWLEWLFWILLCLIALAAILWFLFIKPYKYPTFKRGIITVYEPYFATIRTKGARKIVMTPAPKSQGVFDRILRGKVIYHINTSWPCEVEILPSRKSMRFRCVNNRLISNPSPTWKFGETYKIYDKETDKSVIELNVNL